MQDLEIEQDHDQDNNLGVHDYLNIVDSVGEYLAVHDYLNIVDSIGE